MTDEPTTDPLIVVHDLCFGYTASEVLHNVSFESGEGDLVGIVGPNGGGKTTLLYLLLGLIKPKFGTVNIAGRPPREVRDRIGYVPQHLHFDPRFPVTALDVIVQHQVLKTFRELQERLSLAVIMITHDISVVAETCDKVAVMYAGKIVELAEVHAFFDEPVHPYSLGLQNAFPNLREPDRELISIEGFPPDLVNPPKGCRFADRCPFAQARCLEEEPALIDVGPNHKAACHRWEEVELLRTQAREASTWRHAAVAAE